MTKQTQALAERWAGHECTLNKQPARIVGRFNAVATIASDERAVEFSWQAVCRVMDNPVTIKRGHFRA